MPQQLDELLTTWEKNYKKGLLTFWLLLLLHDQEAYAFEMRTLIFGLSQGSVQVDDNSIYRALRRFTKMQIVESDWQDSSLGPPRKYYRLTDLGNQLLRRFIQQNILIFQTADVNERLEAVLKDEGRPRDE
jgi:PadR family transcriptional regulator PadR